jgi:hypothetical protein
MNDADYLDLLRLLILAGLATGSLVRAEELAIKVGRLRDRAETTRRAEWDAKPEWERRMLRGAA